CCKLITRLIKSTIQEQRRGRQRLDDCAPACHSGSSLVLWRLRAFPDFCEPCLPGPVEQPPAGSDWIHEIKHDGFRLLARRGASAARLFTRNGHDWTARFPLIAAAVDLLRVARA